MLLNKRNLENFIRGNISKQNFCVSEVADYFVVSVWLVFMITASLYESFRKPFVIILSVPMSLIGLFAVTF